MRSEDKNCVISYHMAYTIMSVHLKIILRSHNVHQNTHERLINFQFLQSNFKQTWKTNKRAEHCENAIELLQRIIFATANRSISSLINLISKKKIENCLHSEAVYMRCSAHTRRVPILRGSKSTVFWHLSVGRAVFFFEFHVRCSRKPTQLKKKHV